MPEHDRGTMMSMDFRFPELAASRDPQPDSAPRHRDRADVDFADYLDSSLKDEPVDEPRETRSHDAPRKTSNAQDERDHRDTGADRAADPGKKPVDRLDRAPDEHAVTTEPAQPPAEPVDITESPDAPANGSPVAELPSPVPAEQTASPAEQIVTPMAQAVAAPVAPVLPIAPEVDASAAPVVASTPAAKPVASANAPAPQVPVPTLPAAETLAAPAQPKDAPAPTQNFAGELSVAGKASETVSGVPKAKTAAPQNAAGDLRATSSAPAEPATATPIVAASAPSGENGRGSDGTGNRGFASQQQAQAPAQPAAPAMNDADKSQLAAIVRHAAGGASANRAADSAPAAATLTADTTATDATLDASLSDVIPQPAKSEGPSRPFASVAPGLSVAAQATAQQTPDQASAAERLMQLVAGKEAEAATLADLAGAEPAASAEATASPLRSEQSPHVDAAAQRAMTVDAASAAAAARTARPVFHPIVSQVAVHVAQAAAEGSERISIRLSPAELGRIDVRLDFGPDGRVQAVFAADRPQTVELLQRDARDLERALQDAGLRADSGSLSFNLRGENRNGNSGFAEAAGSGRGDGPVAEVASPQIQAYAAGSAAPGRLDIRI